MQTRVILLLLVCCFSLATVLERRRQAAAEHRSSESFAALLLGEGRMLFANEIFAKADVYFHRGKYPSIFEGGGRPKENHMVGESRNDHAPAADSHEAEHDHSEEGHEHHDHGAEAHDHETEPDGTEEAEPNDWISRFRKKFHAAEHVHLEKGDEREMLPWLKLSAELNPQNIEAYTVAAYWLRTRLNKVDDAEAFLREGLRKNPGNPELLNELAWLKLEARKDFRQARNLWNAAMRRWLETESMKETPDNFLAERIVGGLHKLELDSGHVDRAIAYLELMKRYSPNPESIQRRIEQLRSQAVAQ